MIPNFFRSSIMLFFTQSFLKAFGGPGGRVVIQFLLIFIKFNLYLHFFTLCTFKVMS